MHQPLRTYSLVPSGFVVVTAVHDTATNDNHSALSEDSASALPAVPSRAAFTAAIIGASATHRSLEGASSSWS
jgi:hypothetical protein